MKSGIKIIICIIIFTAALNFSSGFCQDSDMLDNKFDSFESLIMLLKKKDIISQETAEFLMEARDKELTGEEKDTILKDLNEIKDKISSLERETRLSERSMDIPDWVRKVSISGDFRLRYQGEFYDPNNDDFYRLDEPGSFINTHQERNRARIRMRLLIKTQVNDYVQTGLRISTGNEKDPISTNETLGDYYNKDGIVLDQAYLKWNFIKYFNMWFGRMPNPFFSSDLVWDNDINLEGFALNINSLDNPIKRMIGGFFTIGAFPLQEIELSSRDKWLFGSQIGIQYSPKSTLRFSIDAAYYDYWNIEGEENDYPGEKDYTAPLFQQKGNTVFDINRNLETVPAEYGLACDYNELNIRSMMDIGIFFPIHFQFIADYVQNIGFDEEEAAQRFGDTIPKENQGYQVGIVLGYPKVADFGEWQCSFFFKHLESDAVLDAFCDSDFHLGGTNTEGFTAGIQLGLAKNISISTKWLSADHLEGYHYNQQGEQGEEIRLAVDVIQVDLNAKF